MATHSNRICVRTSEFDRTTCKHHRHTTRAKAAQDIASGSAQWLDERSIQRVTATWMPRKSGAYGPLVMQLSQ